MRWKRQAVALGCAVVALAAAGCGKDEAGGSGGSSGGDGDGKFRVLAVLPLSGQVSAIGQADKAAIQTSVDIVNADGGIAGEEVEIKFADSAGTSTQAVSVLQKETSSTDYDFVIAGATSGEAVPMYPFLNRQKLLSCTSAASDELAETPSYVFGTSTLSSRIAQASVVAMQELGYKKVAAMFPDTELARNTLEATKAAAKEAGITLIVELVDPAAVDLKTQMSKLRSKNPDALLLDGFGPVAGVMLKARSALKWDVPVLGNSSFGVNDLTSFVGTKALDGVKLNMQKVDVKGSDVTNTPEFQAFHKALKETSPDLAFGMQVYADNYSCLLLARAAAEKAGSTDSTAMRDALEQITDGTSIKGWFLSQKGFSPDEHYPQYDVENWWDTVPAGKREDGLMVPGQG
jgi:branched-chain amino acid transport system substrate-binding protein